MAKVQVEQNVNALIDDVFASYSDEYGDIYKYNPNLKHSHLLENTPVKSGVGALRQCDMRDGKNWIREKVIKVQENKQIVIDIYEGTVPLKSAIATFDFTKKSNTNTSVRMTMDFEPKMWILGKLMAPMMKKMFRSSMQDLLNANAAYVEKGTQANKTASGHQS